VTIRDPIIQEVLPEERIAKVVAVLDAKYDIKKLTVTDLAAMLSPYIQLEAEDVAHQERVLCLSDFYNLREKLMARERASFQKKSELILQIVSRPEASALGLHVVERDITDKA
jgi:hypothetical protein